jgi:hypothetical protein
MFGAAGESSAAPWRPADGGIDETSGARHGEPPFVDRGSNSAASGTASDLAQLLGIASNERRAVVSGGNIVDEVMDWVPGPRRWRDAAILVEGELVNDLTTFFLGTRATCGPDSFDVVATRPGGRFILVVLPNAEDVRERRAGVREGDLQRRISGAG